MTPFTIRLDLQSIINVGVLRKFAKTNGIEHTGNKISLIRNVIIAVQSGTMLEETVRKFIQEQLWYGKNKHIFFIEVVDETINQFRYTTSLLEYFSARGIQPFNDIDLINIPEGVSLARFEYETDPVDDSIVNKVMLGFVEKIYTYRFEGGGSPVFKAVNTYICVEFDLVNKLLVFRVRSRAKLKESQDINSANITANYLAKKYLDFLQESYGLAYLGGAPEEFKNTMFKIEKSLTNFIELAFKPRVSRQEQLITDFTLEIADKIGLSSVVAPINLCERITGLLERALIVQHEDIITSYVEGKLGYISKFDFRDDRGGRINARSKHSSTPIQTSDIFFDTRETIEGVKLLDTLTMVWFKPYDPDGEDDTQYLLEIANDSDSDDEEDDDDNVIETQGDKKVIRIKIKMAAYTGFYKVEFKRYVLKEEYDHVLSQIDSFRRI